MPRTIQCTHCGVVLNLPEQAMGKRLKCPKCGEKFTAGPAGGPASPVTPGSDVAGQGAAPTVLLKSQSSVDLPVMPTAAGDLRETFDLPMMTEAAAPAARASAGGSPNHAPQVGDALALFNDKPAAPRRKTGAEARMSSRRCPSCNGVVPVGMSLCQSCGLDLDTGTKVNLDDDLAPPPPVRSEGLPIPMAVLGGLCVATSLALAVFALARWGQGTEGAIYFVPVALFGVYASVNFLRAKSVKPLLVALTFGAMLTVVALIALPIYEAQEDAQVVQVTSVDETNQDPDLGDAMIRPVFERIDMVSITRGIELLFLYAVVSIYLLSPQVRRHMRK